MASFGDRLKELRTDYKLTQEQLAKMFFLNKSSISRYEKNKQMPENDMLQKIADYFKVTVDYLLGRTDIKNDTKNDFPLATKELKDIEDVIDKLREQLFNAEDFRIDGKPATKEDIETILDFTKAGIETAKDKKRRNE